MARRALAFCYRFWEEKELPSSTCKVWLPLIIGKQEIRGKGPEVLNFSSPSYLSKLKQVWNNLIGFYSFVLGLYIRFGAISACVYLKPSDHGLSLGRMVIGGGNKVQSMYMG